MSSTRSALMSRIAGKNTEPERLLRQTLWARGFRYRLQAKTPVGRPDIVFRSAQTAVFIDGCFWHGCPDHYVRPRSRSSFWAKKLRENVDRDRRQTAQLEKEGWKVVRVWEHEVYESREATVDAIAAVVRGNRNSRGPRPCVVEVTLIDDQDTERRFHEDLRDPSATYEVVQQRSTRKWKRD